MNFFLFLSYLAGDLIFLKIVEFVIVFSVVEVGVGIVGEVVGRGVHHGKLICVSGAVLVLMSEERPNSMLSCCSGGVGMGCATTVYP